MESDLAYISKALVYFSRFLAKFQAWKFSLNIIL